MKNILITGANGQLGNEMRVLSAEHPEYTYFFTDIAELDICDDQAVRMTIERVQSVKAFCSPANLVLPYTELGQVGSVSR